MCVSVSVCTCYVTIIVTVHYLFDHVEHREKLHGTLKTFEQVDEKIRGRSYCG